MAKKAKEQTQPEAVETAAEVAPEKTPKTPIELINDFIYNKVKLLTRKPPERLQRTAEDVAERKAAAQAKRDRKNAKRLNENSRNK